LYQAVGNFVVGAIAFAALAFVMIIVMNVARNFRTYGRIILGLAIISGGLVVLAEVVNGLRERALMQSCKTAYERQARAAAAPLDYFGKRLREEAAEEARQCAELAAKK
jgi:cytochrome c biogenesis protein CcdA